jgi:thymidine phosphorylase
MPDTPDFTDRVIDFIVEEYLSGKLTDAQVARLVQAFDQSRSTATTVKIPVVKGDEPCP